MQYNHLLFMEEAGRDINLEAEEEIFPKEDTTTVPGMSLVEDRIRTPVNQVVTSLINKKFNVIIVRNLVIMHMNVGRNNMTKERKSQIIQPIPELRRAQC